MSARTALKDRPTDLAATLHERRLACVDQIEALVWLVRNEDDNSDLRRRLASARAQLAGLEAALRRLDQP